MYKYKYTWDFTFDHFFFLIKKRYIILDFNLNLWEQ